MNLFGKFRFKLLLNHELFLLKNFCNLSPLELHQSKVMGRGLPIKKPIDGVKHIILVASGKGGVGKSTTSVNLALALKNIYPELNLGLLDTDVFGPSIPLMMNLHDTPLVNKNNLMIPLTNYGIKCMSMGFLIDEGSPIIWRGLMVMQALNKILRQVFWDNIDYLIVDTPPGTGDTLLSLIQNIPITGVVLVTTPQEAALQVTKRGANMFKKLEIPIIGLIENMSSIVCPTCTKNVKLWGDGTSKLALEIETEVIGSFPLETDTSQGLPTVINNPKSVNSNNYKKLANYIVSYVNKLK